MPMNTALKISRITVSTRPMMEHTRPAVARPLFRFLMDITEQMMPPMPRGMPKIGVAAAHHDSSNSQNQSHNSQSIGFLGPIRGNRLLIRVVLEILTVHLWSSS